jgi:hypothetical protein
MDLFKEGAEISKESISTQNLTIHSVKTMGSPIPCMMDDLCDQLFSRPLFPLDENRGIVQGGFLNQFGNPWRKDGRVN